MRENILTIINHTLGSTWIFTIIGLIYILILENKSILAFIKQKKIKLLKPIFKRGTYLVTGIALITLSFAIVNTLLDVFVPDSFTEFDHSSVKPQGFWSTWKYYTDFSGLFAVIGLIVAGESLILSAGSKWLVNLAKLTITITVLYLFFSVLVAYA